MLKKFKQNSIIIMQTAALSAFIIMILACASSSNVSQQQEYNPESGDHASIILIDSMQNIVNLTDALELAYENEH